MNIIHHRGMVKEAFTEKNVKVIRQEFIYVPEWQAFVQCAPYLEHFIYENPEKTEGTPAHLCTCGSVAMVKGANPKGVFVCVIHEQLGEHSTTFYNLKDIDKMQGKLLSISDNNKRVRIKDRKK